MMAELENLPQMLEQLNNQSFQHFSVYCCVNQEEEESLRESEVYHENQECLSLLRRTTNLDIKIIDRSSKGCGWVGKRKGVGWARKELFAAIQNDCDKNELIVSMDADTHFSSTYLESILNRLNSHPQWNALCVPYYHPLVSSLDTINRSMLRYELYMRYYLLNLLEIDNPYAFSALGSAMAFPLWAYNRVGGITPLQGGEDFYLMQKFAKTGTFGLWLNEVVEPQGRISNRVPFGTGPAIAKGIDSMEKKYPFYPLHAFEDVRKTFATMPLLYENDIETPMSSFLREQLATEDLWGSVRKNFKNKELFIHATEERVDGLRILQYLRIIQKEYETENSCNQLIKYCQSRGINIDDNFDFEHTPIDSINNLRNELFNLELTLRRNHDNNTLNKHTNNKQQNES